VDRASNIQLAAKEITTARLFSNGTSPYSPDLVIVNEYIGEAFGKACLQHANSLGLSAKTRPISIEEKKLQTSLQSEEKNGKIKVHKYGSTDLTIVEILDR
jgi:acyl-CoA reductase-like NAD-dependent aldehyde dehydrogenase